MEKRETREFLIGDISKSTFCATLVGELVEDSSHFFCFR